MQTSCAKVVSVRGAIQVEENTVPAIIQGTQDMVLGLMKKNGIAESDIISVQLSQTKDLDVVNPATALRGVGFAHVPLWCVQELYVVGGMPRVIRVLLTLNWSQTERPKPLYLAGAEALRSDLS